MTTVVERAGVDAPPDVLAEIRAGRPLSLAEAGRSFPPHRGGGESTRPETVHRWITDGVRAADGSRVRLEAVRIGGRWVTSEPAVDRFIRRLSAVPDLAPGPRSPAERNRAADAADKELAAMGY